MVRKGSVKVRFWVPPMPRMCALVVLLETTPVVICTIRVLAGDLWVSAEAVNATTGAAVCAPLPTVVELVGEGLGPEDASILGRPLDPVPFSLGGWHTVMVRKGSVKVRFWVPPIPGMCALVVLSETTPVVIRTICVLAGDLWGSAEAMNATTGAAVFRFVSLSSQKLVLLEVALTTSVLLLIEELIRGRSDQVCIANN